jgi:hypothetical protein
MGDPDPSGDRVSAEEMIAAILNKQKSRHREDEAKKATEEQKKRTEAPKPKPEPKVEPKAQRVRPVEPAFFDESDLTRVPGVVGRMTDWMVGSSLYPNPRLALGASIATTGTLIGQQVAGPTNSSTHLYFVLLALTAGGKQHVLDCGKEALQEAGTPERVGAGDFRSSVALNNVLKRQSCFCSFIDEYGMVLRRICGKGAGGYEFDLVSVAQQVWGINWAMYNSPESANIKSKRVFAPQFSICGVSTPEQFYEAVSSKEVSNGFLNRHLIIRGIDNPKLQHERREGSWKLPQGLKEELAEMYQARSSVQQILDVPLSNIKKPDDESVDDKPFEPEVRMAWGPGAKEVWIWISDWLQQQTDTLRRDLFVRVGEMVIRVATIVAFGRHSRTVDRLDMEWARALVMESAEGLYRDVLKYTVDIQHFPGICKRVLQLAFANFRETKDTFIRNRDLARGCQNYIKKGNELEDAVKFLCVAEKLREFTRLPAPGSKGGRTSRGFYLLVDDEGNTIDPELHRPYYGETGK